MKIILLADVANVGQKFEVKDVADGFALNFLIPGKSARLATPATVKKIETMRAADATERKIQSDLLVKNLKDLSDKTITISVKTNEKGHLFKGLHQKEIAAAIAKETKLTVPAESIILEKPIKSTGEYKISIKIGEGANEKSATFTLVVSNT